MLQCKNVTKKYMKMTAVNGVSIDFMPGRIYALLGSNGSGKTTLLNIIAERLHLSRETVFNRSSFFEDYVRECSYKMTFGKIAPPGSRRKRRTALSMA